MRDRTFAYYLDDHRGDEGITGVVCKVEIGENEALVEAAPDRFYIPAYLGHRGWVGLRLGRAGVNWEEVGSLVVRSYLMVAPKRLARGLLDAG